MEGIQIGEIGSGLGVVGLWTGADHERGDPIGEYLFSSINFLIKIVDISSPRCHLGLEVRIVNCTLSPFVLFDICSGLVVIYANTSDTCKTYESVKNPSFNQLSLRIQSTQNIQT
jgi:hypothetical protein